MNKQKLPDDSRQWDYTDAAQRILIAERCRAMLDALASHSPKWDEGTPDAEREHAVMVFSYLTNAGTDVTNALRYMRKPPMTWTGGATSRISAVSTATAAHACTACGRHPDTHMNGAEQVDTSGAAQLIANAGGIVHHADHDAMRAKRDEIEHAVCPACGLGDEK